MGSGYGAVLDEVSALDEDLAIRPYWILCCLTGSSVCSTPKAILDTFAAPKNEVNFGVAITQGIGGYKAA